jgi:hypothetical protein
MDISLCRIIHEAQYKILKGEQYYSNLKEG